jgi:hypothetical protein
LKVSGTEAHLFADICGVLDDDAQIYRRGSYPVPVSTMRFLPDEHSTTTYSSRVISRFLINHCVSKFIHRSRTGGLLRAGTHHVERNVVSSQR